MAIELSTAGILLAYAVETTKGTKPTAFTRIPGAKSLPDFNPEPSTLETTPLEATEWKTYIDGLKDPGGALSVTFNMTQELQTLWDTIVSAYKTAAESGKKMWWEFYVPGLTQAFFFTGNPSPLGFAGAEVDSVLENTAYITPNGNIGWGTAIKPTDAAA
nr:MAG TPA: tail tube protein [Caudoviricetes sp.]